MSSPAEIPARTPLSTYRFQLNQNFGFRDAVGLVPYLAELGITDLYASPYLQARPGSLHGYDISNHNRINPEIGTGAELNALARALREHEMGHVLDIVPNHMGIGQPDNGWWMDVLENGPSSPFAPFFDIDWNPLKPELAGKVLLPVLGDQFGQILERGELRLTYENERFRIRYFENVFPVSPRSMALVLRGALDLLGDQIADDDADRIELESIVTALEHLPPRDRTDPESVKERRRENVVARRRIATLHESSAAFRRALERAIEAFNGRIGEPHSFDRLERLIDDQPYRLSYWRVAAEEINYRRFFDINDLAGVRVERPEVFQETHRLILRLVAEGKVTGLRIDHPDGLFDPPGYLRELQAEAARRSPGSPFYVIVEKILTGDESLPPDWQVAGTVGYEFLNRVNGLFVDANQAERMEAVYAGFLGRTQHFPELVYERKKLILRVALASELNVLAYLLDRISEQNRRVRDFTLGSLTDALREVIAGFPIYRTYIDAYAGRVSDTDKAYVERAIRTAMRRNRATSPTIFEFIRNILLLQWPDDLGAEAREEHARFVMKFQQLTGPVMAKGLEDTSFYIYNRLVSLNEVGGEPDHFGVEPAGFHEWIGRRRERWPASMNNSSTHDTKRSEDVRARINVLSEIPDEWERRVTRWAECNAEQRETIDGESVPDRNDEYLLYQTLVGAWPLAPMDAAAHESFVGRVQQYMEKATREAKVHTSWINPNEEYDRGLRDFVARILERPPEGEARNLFLEDLEDFHPRVACCGMLNALSQTLLKLTCPGVPDVYQGQEVWDFSLVDPDNRRPVDYDRRREMLAELRGRLAEADRGDLAAELLQGWQDGRAKLYLTHVALRLRREDPDLFLRGSYVPLAGHGPREAHVLAFARHLEDRTVVVVAPRLWAGFVREACAVPDGSLWSQTVLEGPIRLLTGTFRNLLGGGEIRAEGRGRLGTIPLARVLDRFPVALLERTG
jgi:(1->4)-alpha-D-glucan 1-alpha-D-glucosylmutase